MVLEEEAGGGAGGGDCGRRGGGVEVMRAVQHLRAASKALEAPVAIEDVKLPLVVDLTTCGVTERALLYHHVLVHRFRHQGVPARSTQFSGALIWIECNRSR